MGKQDFTRRDFLKAVSLGAASLALPGCVSGAQQPMSDSFREKPNFVLILVDDFGWRDVGCSLNHFGGAPVRLPSRSTRRRRPQSELTERLRLFRSGASD